MSRPALGVSLPTAPWEMASVAAFAEATRVQPGVLSWHQHWGIPESAAPRPELLRRAAEVGAVPLIAWEPWRPDDRGDATWDLLAIARGKHDRYVDEWARMVRSHRGRVMLRFAHEMNGDWYPWGDRPRDFLAAWARVQERFAAAGARNVEWVWCPNVDYPGARPLRRFWPGEALVDWVALDGYCWGAPWVEPDELFRPSLRQAAQLAPRKPLLIAETACAEDRRKPEWILQLAKLPAAALVWFNHAKERDWRVDSSPQSLAAFRRLARD